IETQDYIQPTADQTTWIFRNYLPSRVEWWSGYGFLTIFTDTPSLLGHAGLVTLTIACVPVIFVPREAQGTFLAGPPIPNRIFYCHISIPDPFPLFKPRSWTGPSMEEAHMILNHLGNICNVHALNFILSQYLI